MCARCRKPLRLATPVALGVFVIGAGSGLIPPPERTPDEPQQIYYPVGAWQSAARTATAIGSNMRMAGEGEAAYRPVGIVTNFSFGTGDSIEDERD